MKRKNYQKPMMEVIECEQEVQLMAGSPTQSRSSVQDYSWQNEEEE